MVRIVQGQLEVLNLHKKEDVPSPSEFHERYIRPRKPVILSNYINVAAASDTMLKEWQLGIAAAVEKDMEEIVSEMKGRQFEMANYWKNRFQDLDIFVSELRENGLSHPPNYEIVRLILNSLFIVIPQKMKFDQVIEHLKEQESTQLAVNSKWLYMQQVPVKDLPGLSSDFKVPTLFDASPYSLLGANSFFLGTTGTRTTLHYDR